MHIDFLHKYGYLHIIDKIELDKMINKEKTNFEGLNNFIKKTLPSAKRWNRAMKIVWGFRIKHGLIMEKIRPGFAREKCDACDTTFGKGEPECHHIIPKRIMGPESSFNYAYLCINCHKSFTHNRINKNKLIKKIIDKKLVNYETIMQMIANGEIVKNHLDYLLKEGYINNEIYKKLIKLI
jgi:hypothetical protein